MEKCEEERIRWLRGVLHDLEKTNTSDLVLLPEDIDTPEKFLIWVKGVEI